MQYCLQKLKTSMRRELVNYSADTQWNKKTRHIYVADKEWSSCIKFKKVQYRALYVECNYLRVCLWQRETDRIHWKSLWKNIQESKNSGFSLGKGLVAMVQRWEGDLCILLPFLNFYPSWCYLLKNTDMLSGNMASWNRKGRVVKNLAKNK